VVSASLDRVGTAHPSSTQYRLSLRRWRGVRGFTTVYAHLGADDLTVDQQLALRTAARRLDDPAGLGVDAVRPIRDAIEQRIRRLLDEINVPASA
jgi:hypothetical protein